MTDTVEQAILSMEGRGFITRKTVRVTQPNAGADFTVTSDGGELWIPLALTAQLVTSAVVATRQPRLEISNSDGIIAVIGCSDTMTATTTHVLSWMRGYGANVVGGTSNRDSMPLPDLALMPGETVASVTTNIDVGDQWSNIRLTVLRIYVMSPERRAEQEGYGFESGFPVPYRTDRSDTETYEQ